MQVIAEATAIDDKAAAGESITPLCGLPLVSYSAHINVGSQSWCAQ